MISQMNIFNITSKININALLYLIYFSINVRLRHKLIIKLKIEIRANNINFNYKILMRYFMCSKHPCFFLKINELSI